MAFRTVELAKVAAQAEKLRLQQLASRSVTRVVLAAVAAVFAVAVVIGLHVAGGMALGSVMNPVWAVLIVALVDLVIAGICGGIALTKGPGTVEIEALQVRQAAQAQIKEQLAFTALAIPAARVLGGRRLAGLTVAAMTARRYLGSRH